MDNEEKKDNSFLIGLCITLGTIIVGMTSYIVYSSNFSKKEDRCEYNGWAYADGEVYDSSDGCNYCFCNDGETVCTSKVCSEEYIN